MGPMELIGLMCPCRLLPEELLTVNRQLQITNPLMMVLVIALLVVPAIFHIHAHHHLAHVHS